MSPADLQTARVIWTLLLPGTADGDVATTTVTFLPAHEATAAPSATPATVIQAARVVNVTDGFLDTTLIANIEYVVARPGQAPFTIYPTPAHTSDAPLDLSVAAEVAQAAPERLPLIQRMHDEALQAAKDARAAADEVASGGGSGGVTAGYVSTQIAAHASSKDPHPSYDSAHSFTLLLQNGLI